MQAEVEVEAEVGVEGEVQAELEGGEQVWTRTKVWRCSVEVMVNRTMRAGGPVQVRSLGEVPQ